MKLASGDVVRYGYFLFPSNILAANQLCFRSFIAYICFSKFYCNIYNFFSVFDIFILVLNLVDPILFFLLCFILMKNLLNRFESLIKFSWVPALHSDNLMTSSAENEEWVP